MEQAAQARILRVELVRQKGSNYVARTVLDDSPGNGNLERKVEGKEIHGVAKKAVEEGWVIDQRTQYQTIREPSFDAATDMYQDPATGKEFSEFYRWYCEHKKIKEGAKA